LGLTLGRLALLIGILSDGLLLLTPIEASPVCLNGHPTVATEYRLRSVFIGTVLAERYEPPTKIFDQEGTTYAVRIDEPLRGRFAKTILLFSENSSGRFPMQVGTKYLLFVYRYRGRTSVDNCGNSEVFSTSSPTLREVRRLSAATKNRQ
jgi:hypothetical protein